MRGHSLFILLIFLCLGLRGQDTNDRDIFVTGVICDRDSVQPLPDAIYRFGQEVRGVDNQGRFSVHVKVGDTLYFSHVGFEPVRIVVSDTLKKDDYLLGIFMVRDTIQLAEVVVLPRFFMEDFKMDSDLITAHNNMKGAVNAASRPVKEMDREMNQKMVISDLARKVEMKGMVDVKLGIGTQSYTALKGLMRSRRMADKGKVIRVQEIDLLKKIFYIEKREKTDN
ncbi:MULTISPECIES: hypothetical protein [Butyricimonas]|uniref:hypothetical protein n=1 Tax=Butyricimonas TaxID=574697 RepID=UPI001D08F757|nr:MULTISPECIES: hypothetical protein [Butyricimonas]MCB6973425.1 hypothetical protein [Butyricimonas synergistica]MCG4520104.1 hypothetical protein [Butyricimonas sp. DFI.6.44]